jgi:multicomponent Na+:H+ antiporter subunit C
VIDTSPSIALVAVAGVLVAVGVYLLLERSLSRVLIGVILMSNGVNVVFLIAGGRAGGAPIIGATDEDAMSDPLPQAMVLTAIVITLGLTAFLLAMAYRSWQMNGHDEVQDDLEDRRVAERAAAHQAAFASDDDGASLEQEAAEAHDEVVTDGRSRDRTRTRRRAPRSGPVGSAEGGDTR